MSKNIGILYPASGHNTVTHVVERNPKASWFNPQKTLCGIKQYKTNPQHVYTENIKDIFTHLKNPDSHICPDCVNTGNPNIVFLTKIVKPKGTTT